MLALVDFMFLNMALATLVVGIFVNFLEDKLPSFVTKTFRYGKFAEVESCDAKGGFDLIRSSQVPKSTFRHFYILATILSSSALVTAIRLYIFGIPVPKWLILFLDFWCGHNRLPLVNTTTSLIVLFLMTLQCIRRFYETFFIQVFSKTAKINLSHYFIGHFHYFGCIVIILGQSIGFTNNNLVPPRNLDLQMSAYTLPAILTFLFAWLNQFKSNIVLANLRKDNNSKKVVSQKYFLPQDGWFKYISCPHQLCEIILYLSLTLLLFKSTSWLFVVMWVVSNQVETALLSHWWYQKTFPKMPKGRKALIPFLL